MMLRAALLLALAGSTPCVFAQQGALDADFGNTGVRTYGNDLAGEQITALLADENGAAFAAGILHMRTGDNDADMFVLRILDDGRFDPDWGAGGLREISLGGGNEGARALLRVSDAGAANAPELLVAGFVKAADGSSSTDFAVARLTHAGALDPTFGDPVGGVPRGFTVFNMTSPGTTFLSDEAYALAMQSDGKILVAGKGKIVGRFATDSFAIARLTTTGQLDANFGQGGKLFTPGASDDDEYVTAIALHRDGRLDADDSFVVAGYISGPSPRAVMRRYQSNGSLDPGFGNQGTLVIPEVPPRSGAAGTGVRRIEAAVLQDDGKIVVAGYGGENGFVFLRYSAAGVLDTTFGDGGRKLVKLSGATDFDAASSLVLQADGKILAGGQATSRETSVPEADFAAVRLLRNGQLDPTWGTGGRVSYPVVASEGDRAFAIALMSDNTVLLGGEADVEAGPGGNFNAAFMRLLGDPSLFRDGFEN